jgi:hypothetical protein
MFCPNCGNPVAPKADFCLRCGEDLSPYAEVKRGPANWMIGLAAIAAIAAIGLAIWSSFKIEPGTADPRAQVSVPRTTPTATPSPTQNPTPTPTPGLETEPGDYRTYRNERFDFSISYPSNYLIAQESNTLKGDGRKFVSKDGRVEMVVYAHDNDLEQSLREIYEKELKPDRQITSAKIKDKWFAVSGYENGKVFYQKTILKDDIVKTFHLEADRMLQPVVQPMAEKIVKSFK